MASLLISPRFLGVDRLGPKYRKKRERPAAEDTGLDTNHLATRGSRLLGAAKTFSGLAQRSIREPGFLAGLLRFVGERLLGDNPPPNLYAYFKHGTLHITHDAGFFSICATALFEIAQNSSEITEIDASHSFKFFKSPGTLQNPWPLYFESPKPLSRQQSGRVSKSRLGSRLPHHAEYWLVDFRSASLLVANFFEPSRMVNERIGALKSQYRLDMSKIIAVCFRGTDKGTEVRQAPVGKYLTVVRRLVRRYPDHRVLLQTDDSRAKNIFLAAFGEKLIAIEEIPTTYGSTVMHKSIEASERENFGLNLLAVVKILAEAHSVVTYTGNMGYWIALFRGGAKRLVQLR